MTKHDYKKTVSTFPFFPELLSRLWLYEPFQLRFVRACFGELTVDVAQKFLLHLQTKDEKLAMRIQLFGFCQGLLEERHAPEICIAPHRQADIFPGRKDVLSYEEAVRHEQQVAEQIRKASNVLKAKERYKEFLNEVARVSWYTGEEDRDWTVLKHIQADDQAIILAGTYKYPFRSQTQWERLITIYMPPKGRKIAECLSEYQAAMEEDLRGKRRKAELKETGVDLALLN